MLRKAAEATAAGLAVNVKAAEAAGERMKAGVAQAIASAEENLARLKAQADANLEAAEQATRQMATLPQTAFAGVGNAGAAVAEGMARARQEATEFVTGRIRRDLEAQSELLGCRSIEDLGAVQSKFIRAAFDDYMSGAGRILNLGTEVVSRSMPAR
jgi:hypothetical protein